MLRRLQRLLRAAPASPASLSPFVTRYPPGHFYSPLPDPARVREHRERYFGTPPTELPGIDLRTDAQLALFDRISATYLPEMPAYTLDAQEGLRFYHRNDFYSCKDAALLYGMLRELRPRRIIEAGSGFSSALMLDINDCFFNRGIEFTFIEPYPERLKKLLRPEDKPRTKIIVEPLEDVSLDTFRALEAGDILFIDSTHVSKIGSDVNFIFFELLPVLNAGVYIHIHDIFYPFEYLEHWLVEGRAWNEAYLLRAFLMYNMHFEICLFTSHLKTIYPERFQTPPWKRVPEGGSWGSLWLRKCRS